MKVGAGVAVAGVAGYARFENTWLEVRRLTIPIRDLPPAFEGYRIGLATDFHYPRRMNLTDLRSILGVLEAEKPDILCFPGDLYDLRYTPDSAPMTEVLNSLQAPDGVLVTRGNHDWAAPPVAWQSVQASGVKVIEGNHLVLQRKGESLAFAGVGDLWFDRIDLKSTLAGLPASVPRILLCHNPDFAEDYEGNERVDLMLSGHLHGGQIRFAGFAPYVPSRYDNKFIHGLVQGKAIRVFTSRGITRSAGFRLQARPDVTVLTLTHSG